MPIDASIPLQVRPVQLDNPLTQYANVMAIQNAMTQNRLGNLNIEELQRKRAEEESVRNVFQQNPNDRKAVINALMGLGLYPQAQALEKADIDATKSKLEVDQKQLENAAKRFAIVGTGFAQLAQNPNATPQDALQLVQAYQKEQILPPKWEQNVPQNAMAVRQFAQQMAMRSEQGAKYLEEFKSKPKLVNDGKRQFYVEENPRLATFGKEISMSFENQPTPGELLTDKRQAPLAAAQTRLADAQASYNYGGAFGGGIQPQPAAPVPSAPIGALPQAAPGGALPLIPGIQPTQPLAPTLGRIPLQTQANAANDRRAILMAELAKQQEAGRVDPALVREIAAIGGSPVVQGQNVNIPQPVASGITIPPELANAPQALKDKYIFEKAKGNPESKPLPAPALKLQQEALESIGTASSLSADIEALRRKIERGELKLGPITNLVGQGLNFAGMSTENSRELATFKAMIEKIRNDSLLLNKGVQTEGDAVRALNQIMANINDPDVVKKRLQELKNINDRAVTLQRMNIDNIRQNYGHAPLDTSKYQFQESAITGSKAAPQGWRVIK